MSAVRLLVDHIGLVSGEAACGVDFFDFNAFLPCSTADLWRNGGEEPLPLSAHHPGHAGQVPGRGEWNHH